MDKSTKHLSRESLGDSYNSVSYKHEAVQLEQPEKMALDLPKNV